MVKKIMLCILSLMFIVAALPACQDNTMPIVSPSPDDEIITGIPVVPEGNLRLDIPVKNNGRIFDGIGGQFDGHLLSMPNNTNWGVTKQERDMIFERVKYIGVQKIRVMVLPNWHEPINDNNDPEIISSSGFNYDTDEIKALFHLLDFAEENGISVLLTWWPPRAGHFLHKVGSHAMPVSNDEYVENIVALVKHLIFTKKYTCIEDITPMNEPYGCFKDAVGGTFMEEEFYDLCRLLELKMRQHNLRDKVRLNNIDSPTSNWVTGPMEHLHEVSDIFNSHNYELYNYSTNQEILDWFRAIIENADKYNKPYMMGELGTRPLLSSYTALDTDTVERALFLPRLYINALNAGAVGGLHWVISDMYYNDPNQLMQLGFWKFKYDNWTYRPMYYSMSLLTKYTKKNSEIYPVVSENPDVCAVALKSKEGKWTYLVSNSSNKDIKFSFVNLGKNVSRLKRFVFSSSALPEDMSDGKMIEPSGEKHSGNGVISDTIIANSFMLYTNLV